MGHFCIIYTCGVPTFGRTFPLQIDDETSGMTTSIDNCEDGPLSMLTEVVKKRLQVMVMCRNNKKVLGRVKAFDRWVDVHCVPYFLLMNLFCFQAPQHGHGGGD